MNPDSSARTQKMKSVCRSGRKRRWVCVPCSHPCPRNPPPPTAIKDWMAL